MEKMVVDWRVVLAVVAMMSRMSVVLAQRFVLDDFRAPPPRSASHCREDAGGGDDDADAAPASQ